MLRFRRSFGTDGVSSFQGLKNGVTTQIKEKYAPFATGIHCCAHHLNLAAQSLSSLPIMHAIEEVLQLTHNYFAHSPKKAAEFRALSQQLESKGLKLLKNVKTRWMSCLGPIRRLLVEYKGVLAMMHADKNDKRWGQRAWVSSYPNFFNWRVVGFHYISILFLATVLFLAAVLTCCTCFVYLSILYLVCFHYLSILVWLACCAGQFGPPLRSPRLIGHIDNASAIGGY